MRTKLMLVLLLAMSLSFKSSRALPSSGSTSTEWRNDEANLEVVREFNRALEHIPFSSEHEGVLDQCPFRIDWSLGPNLPMPWKGGISGVFGSEIILTGGGWGDGGPHSFSYDTKAAEYREITKSPVVTSFTQGAADDRHVYLVGGKSAGQTAAKLGREQDGTWRWSSLPSVPEANRWTSVVNVAGRWLLLYRGRDMSKPARVDLPAWRLRLDKPDARWEPMAPYPGQASSVITSAVIRGKVYAFGGWREVEALEEMSEAVNLWKKYRIWPFSSIIEYRDAYRYDPEKNEWRAIRRLPFPRFGGKGIALNDRYILLMGIGSQRTTRVGKSIPERKPLLDQYWTGFEDTILCYDIEQDNYSRVGLMLYGVSSWNWALVDNRLYCFGGEPKHGFNSNRENVVQIGTIREAGAPRPGPR